MLTNISLSSCLGTSYKPELCHTLQHFIWSVQCVAPFRGFWVRELAMLRGSLGRWRKAHPQSWLPAVLCHPKAWSKGVDLEPEKRSWFCLHLMYVCVSETIKSLNISQHLHEISKTVRRRCVRGCFEQTALRLSVTAASLQLSRCPWKGRQAHSLFLTGLPTENHANHGKQKEGVAGKLLKTGFLPFKLCSASCDWYSYLNKIVDSV